jgi:hypothetical protein
VTVLRNKILEFFLFLASALRIIIEESPSHMQRTLLEQFDKWLIILAPSAFEINWKDNTIEKLTDFNSAKVYS